MRLTTEQTSWVITYLPSSLLHPAGQLLCLSLPLHEDDDLGVSLGGSYLRQDLLHLPVLASLLTDVHNLENVVVGRQLHGPDIDVDIVLAEELLGQLLDVPGPGGGQHQDLSVRPHLAEDLSDLRLEPHVQHPVGFIQHHEGGSGQGELLTLN